MANEYNEYLIKGETLDAIGNKIREYVDVNSKQGELDPTLVYPDGTIDQGAITAYYEEYIDSSGTKDYGIRTVDEILFEAYDYLENNDGTVVPVLYEYFDDELCTNQPYYYEGTSDIDGVTYDKWRVIELGNDTFNWDSVEKKYTYTNRVIINKKIPTTNIPDEIENVYNKGYEDGNAGADAGGKPVLYGSYILKESIDYTGVSPFINHIFEGNAYFYWSHSTLTVRSKRLPIYDIEFNANGIEIIENEGDYLLTYQVSAQSWKTADDADEDLLPETPPIENYRIIEFIQPFEVPQEFYDLFMSIIDLTEITPYEIGRETAIAEGEVAEITYDSTYKTLTITTG